MLSFRSISLVLTGAVMMSAASAATLQDGCYQMYTRSAGGIDDAGAICLSGLNDEGVGQNLRIVTVDTQGQKHFCGSSNNFSFGLDNPSQPNVTIQLSNVRGTITFTGSETDGTLKIGNSTLQYRYLPDESSERFFAQCR